LFFASNLSFSFEKRKVGKRKQHFDLFDDLEFIAFFWKKEK